VSGTVTAVKVAEGDHVHKEQVLARVDSAVARATLASARATLADARARLDTDTSAGADSTQLAADSTAVTAAKGQVSSAKDALASATLTSPIAGLVVSVNLTVGQQVRGRRRRRPAGWRSGRCHRQPPRRLRPGARLVVFTGPPASSTSRPP
jgi:macrolide-specific efflux system membrane fusion protein